MTPPEHKVFFNIICVTFNAASCISYTLKSIAEQTFKSYELLIIDGASNDNTVEIINNCIINNVKIISERDRGIYDAMNKGIQMATSDWIIFMNAGDSFASSFTLEKVYSVAVDSSAEILYGNTIIKNSKKKIPPPSSISKYYFFSNTLCHQSVFIKTKIFNEIGKHNLSYKILADRDFFFRAAKQKIQFEKVDIDISIWDPDGFSSKNISIYKDEEKKFRKNYTFIELLYVCIIKIIKYV